MTIAAIKEKLHKYIDTTDDKHINDLLLYVENSQTGNYEVDDQDLAELHKRAESCINGSAVTFAAEEAHTYIRNNRKK